MSNGGAKRTKSLRATVVIAGLAALFVALATVNLCVGSMAIAPYDLVAALCSPDRTGTVAQVVWSIRLPRLIAAGLLGAALALAGVLLQTFFNNPLAGPYVLGISSGAKLAVAVLMVMVMSRAGIVTSWMSIGAATDFLVTFAGDASIVNLRNWSMGSFSGTSWGDVRAMAIVVISSSIAVFCLAKPLGAYQLGEAYAQSMGVNVHAFRKAIIALSSLLSACVTAFAGPISFVGIAVPHVAKRLLGTSRPSVVLPATFLGGADFCLMCDLIARTAFAPTEMSVSAVTALFGAPVVIWVLLGKQEHVGEV